MSLWRNPGFVRLWAAATISTFGSLISRTALPFAAILTLDAKPLDVGFLTIAELAPGFVIGLFAGVWVDRLPRRPILIATDLGRAIALATIPVAAFAGSLTLVHLYLVAAVTSVLSVCFDVAYQSFLPTLVDRAELVEGNSKLTAAGAVAETAAFGTGGWLVQLLSAPIAVLIDGLTFIASAAFVLGIRAPEAPRSSEEAHAPMLREIGEGLRVVAGKLVLRMLAISNAVLNLGYSIIGTVYLLYVNQELGFAPGILGMVFAVGGLSSLLGATVAGRVGRFGVGPTLIASLALTGLGLGLVPLASGAGLIALAFLVVQQLLADGPATVYEIGQVSLRQAITPDRLLGRVNACIRVLEVGAMLLGALLGGILGERLGLRPTLVLGVGAILVAALVLWRSPVRHLRTAPPLPDQVGSVPQTVETVGLPPPPT